MHHILITQPVPGNLDGMLTKAGFRVTTLHGRGAPTKKRLIAALKSKPFDGLVTLLTDTVDEEVLDAAPQLRIVSNYAIGFNNIAVDAAKKRGVTVANTPISHEYVAEFALGLIFALALRIPEADRFVRAGRYAGWNPDLMLGTAIGGATLGLVGTGRIGGSVARRAHALGMKVVYYDPNRNADLERECDAAYYASVKDLAKVADYVSVHVPLLPQTHHLINDELLSAMKQSAFLINTSRGPVVDEKALITALTRGDIAGAALDVYENEPKIPRALRAMPNVILTPHIGSAREGARREMSEMTAANLVAYFKGERPKGIIQ